MHQSDPAVFHAIADSTRRDLLLLLRLGERSASELAEPFDITRSAVSQHLGILLSAGLVERRREGRHRLYRLRAEPLEHVDAWVEAFRAFWDDRFRRLGTYLDEKGASDADVLRRGSPPGGRDGARSQAEAGREDP